MIETFSARLRLDPTIDLHQQVATARLEALQRDSIFEAGGFPDSMEFNIPQLRNSRPSRCMMAKSDGIWLKMFSADRNGWFDIADQDFPDTQPCIEHDQLLDRLEQVLEAWQYGMIEMHGFVDSSIDMTPGFYPTHGIMASAAASHGTWPSQAWEYTISSTATLQETMEFHQKLVSGRLLPDYDTMSALEMLNQLAPALDCLQTLWLRRHPYNMDFAWALSDLAKLRLPSEFMVQTQDYLARNGLAPEKVEL